MSHHSGSVDEEMAEIVNRFTIGDVAKMRSAKMSAIVADGCGDAECGKSGKFPNGKLTEKDEGALRIRVVPVGQSVIVDFRTPVAWIGLRPDQAIELAEALLAMAKEVFRK